MNKNFENYKNTFSFIRPSDEAVERVMNMTNEKKFSFKPILKRVTATALALAVLVGGGLGISYVSRENDSIDELGVLIAYASTGEFLEVGNQSNQEFFYSLHIIPENDEEAAKAAQEKLDADKKRVEEDANEAAELGSTYQGTHGAECYDSSGNSTAMIYGVSGGFIALDIDDYSEVKTLTVENAGKYGKVSLNIQPTPWLSGNKIKVTGDDLVYSQQYYLDKQLWVFENKGYAVNWRPSEKLCDAIGNDVHFDLSNIKDTIKFTVVYNDGTVQTGSLNLYFDSDGYMHFGEN